MLSTNDIWQAHLQLSHALPDIVAFNVFYFFVSALIVLLLRFFSLCFPFSAGHTYCIVSLICLSFAVKWLIWGNYYFVKWFASQGILCLGFSLFVQVRFLVFIFFFLVFFCSAVPYFMMFLISFAIETTFRINRK